MFQTSESCIKLHAAAVLEHLLRAHCSKCVCTWMGQIQRTHFTASYTLFFLKPISDYGKMLKYIRSISRQECLRLSDWGLLLLDVIMNIAVIIYSRHLSCWRRKGLTLLSLWSECADPDLPKCVNVRANHSWSSPPTEEVCISFFLWIYANRLS